MTNWNWREILKLRSMVWDYLVPGNGSGKCIFLKYILNSFHDLINQQRKITSGHSS